MPRTTLTLDNHIFQSLKGRAVREGKSFKELVNDLLGWALGQQQKSGNFALKWHVVDGLGPPAVSIDDRDRLYDFLDQNK